MAGDAHRCILNCLSYSYIILENLVLGMIYHWVVLVFVTFSISVRIVLLGKRAFTPLLIIFALYSGVFFFLFFLPVGGAGYLSW